MLEAAGHQRRQTVPHQALLAELLHLFHHAGHVLILLQQAVDVRYRGTRSGGDAAPTRAVQEFRVLALGFGH